MGNGNQKSASPGSLFVDIGLTTLKILAGADGVEVPITREDSGRLSPASRDAAREALTRFRARDGRAARAVRVAIPASGVSVRRFRLPPATREATRKLVNLQLEQSFPVPPDQLAWGYRIYAAPDGVTGNPTGSRQDVAALVVRRDVIDDYEEMFAGTGLRPTFTLGILAAAGAALSARESALVVDVGRHHTECLRLDRGVPVQVRTLAWGGESVTTALNETGEVNRSGAETRKHDPLNPASSPGLSQARQEALGPLVRFLAEAVPSLDNGSTEAGPAQVRLTGTAAALPGLDRDLTAALGGLPCRVDRTEETGPGRSAVTLGLRDHAPAGSDDPAIRFTVAAVGSEGEAVATRRRLLPWMALAGVLLVAIVASRYLPAVLGRRALQQERVQARERLAMLPVTGPELRFLDELDRRRLRVLEALTVTALAAPERARLNELSLNSQGAFTLKMTLKPTEYNEFRAKLIRSGWFTDVVLQRLEPGKGGVVLPLTATLTPPPTGLDGVAEKLDVKATAPALAAGASGTASPGTAPKPATGPQDRPASLTPPSSGSAPPTPGRADIPDAAGPKSTRKPDRTPAAPGSGTSTGPTSSGRPDSGPSGTTRAGGSAPAAPPVVEPRPAPAKAPPPEANEKANTGPSAPDPNDPDRGKE